MNHIPIIDIKLFKIEINYKASCLFNYIIKFSCFILFFHFFILFGFGAGPVRISFGLAPHTEGAPFSEWDMCSHMCFPFFLARLVHRSLSFDNSPFLCFLFLMAAVGRWALTAAAR